MHSHILWLFSAANRISCNSQIHSLKIQVNQTFQQDLKFLKESFSLYASKLCLQRYYFYISFFFSNSCLYTFILVFISYTRLITPFQKSMIFDFHIVTYLRFFGSSGIFSLACHSSARNTNTPNLFHHTAHGREKIRITNRMRSREKEKSERQKIIGDVTTLPLPCIYRRCWQIRNLPLYAFCDVLRHQSSR